MLISKKSKAGVSKEGVVPKPPPGEFSVARRKMVEEQLRARGIHDERVLQVMGLIPRHSFVDEALVTQAYGEGRLNIGFGQTMSLPNTVALLSQALNLKGEESVLEIGTGCGYQTAVLASLAFRVFSVERLQPLLLKGRMNLKRLQIKNVVLKYGDGSRGWPEKAPFDAIVAAAVSPTVPEPLTLQLKEGGRLVLPIERGGKQYLIRIVRRDGSLKEENLGECRFVKMVGHHAYTV